MTIIEEAKQQLDDNDRKQAISIVNRFLREEKNLKIKLSQVEEILEKTKTMTITEIIQDFAGEGEYSYGNRRKQFLGGI